MNEAWLDGYIAAWQLYPAAGGPEGADALARLLDFISDDVRYEDMPSGLIYEGHDRIASMCADAYRLPADLRFTTVSRQTDGRSYAFECLGPGTNTGAFGPFPATGRQIEFRGVCVGEISADGLVTGHRDYWDMASFLRQLGVR